MNARLAAEGRDSIAVFVRTQSATASIARTILTACYLKNRRERKTTKATAISPNTPAPPISMAKFPDGMPGLLVWLDCPLPVSLNVGVGLGDGVGIGVGDGVREGLGVGVVGPGAVVGVMVGCAC